jgi:hypothetical protein
MTQKNNNNGEGRGYWAHNYCPACRRWFAKEFSSCPFCGNPWIRRTPKMPRCRRKYTRDHRYTPEQAWEIYRRFLTRGYSREEAAEFTRAITGLEIEAEEEAEAIAVEAAGT